MEEIAKSTGRILGGSGNSPKGGNWPSVGKGMSTVQSIWLLYLESEE